MGYKAPAAISMIHPAHGDQGGGTLVTLFGRHFVQSSFGQFKLVCNFGTSQSSGARFVSSTLTQCEAPPNLASDAHVLLELAGPAGKSRSLTGFIYEESITLESLTPGSGPVRGGTMLTISGTGFTADDVLYCRFGTHTPISAELSNDGTVRCKSVAHTTGKLDVSVSAGNLFDFRGGLTFQY